jgi:4'-phosphopantetheinyl transferase
VSTDGPVAGAAAVTAPVLTSGDVHVWTARLDVPPPEVEESWRTLSDDEQSRARRFVFEHGRRRFIVGRGLLRRLLGHYAGVAPEWLEFSYGRYGKPAVAGPSSARPLRFNLSHCEDLALYAVTRGREVGVDVERIRPEFATLDIAERFFSSGEVAVLRAVADPGARARAFFACWTRKEAYIKARGEGLSFPLHRFRVSLEAGAPAALLDVSDDPGEVSRWCLESLDPGGAFVGALVVEGQGWRLGCRQWPGG